MDQRRERAVAFAFEFNGFAFARHFCAAFRHAVLAFGLKTAERPRPVRSMYSRQNICFNSAPLTSRPSLSTSSLAMGPNSRCMSLGNWMPNSLSSKYATPPLPDCEFTRMTSRYSRPMSAGSIVRYGTSQYVARLACPFGQALLDGVLMRAAEGGEHEFARVRLARREWSCRCSAHRRQ